MSARRSISMVSVWLCAIAAGLLLWSAPALAQREHAFTSSFGGEGSGNGQFLQPGELAVNEETGDVYVIDRGNERVDIFSSAGAYVGQFNGSASPTGAFAWPDNARVTVATEGAIAVDNSTNPLDPSKGDVYVVEGSVVDKFSASGAYIGQIAGTPFGAEVELAGVAVDAEGGLWVQTGEYFTEIYRFNDVAPVNEYVSTVNAQIPKESGHLTDLGTFGLALDSEDDLYAGASTEGAKSPSYPIEFSKAGEPLVERLDREVASGIAVDESSGDVYVDHETSIAAYNPSHDLIERFGSGQLQVSEGIAVDSATGTVYAANTGSEEIDVFNAFVVPDATTGAASNLAETSVSVSGVVDPDGLPVTGCVFEYGTSTAYGQSEPCAPAPGSGSAPVEVTAHLTGLKPLTEYHFRLNVSNANGSNAGQDRTFTTPQPAALSEEAVSDVSSTSALFSAQINPGGAETTYAFEYGTSVAYGASVPVPAGELQSGTNSVPVSVRVEALLGETAYHVRLVASNLLGTVYGPDQVFTTQAAGGAFALPDGREWELVSPPNKDGALIAAIGQSIGIGQPGLIQASVDGGAIAYYADGPVGANVSGNSSPAGVTQVLSRRGADGWSSEDLTRPHRVIQEGADVEDVFFSADLSQALVEPSAFGKEPSLLSPEATEPTAYVRRQSLCEAPATASGCYLPLVTAGNVPPGTTIGPGGSQNSELEVKVPAVTPDLSHAIIMSGRALTANAEEVGPGENLYEWSGGRLQLVNELPDHTVSQREAHLGSAHFGEDTRNALSSDGSRVFFTVGTVRGHQPLYVRDTAAGQTVRVDTPEAGVSQPPISDPEFQIASTDGSDVFFTENEPLTLASKLEPTAAEGAGSEDLYVYDVATGSLTDLTVDQNAGEVADVRNVVGLSDDGSIVYFVAEGKLAEGAEAGGNNLYVESRTGSAWSAPRLVAALSGGDAHDWEVYGSLLTSRVSSNGRYMVFMSERSLTGYDNRDAVSGQPDDELFLYDNTTGVLSCVSCNPTGARPDGIFDKGGELKELLLVDEQDNWAGHALAAIIPGRIDVRDASTSFLVQTYMSRVLSDEGRIFFDSADALVPQDTNGRIDVYEYEPQGVGNCTRGGGCVSLVSSGTSAEESVFLDASESGDDVFFLTAARLVPGDVDSAFDVYDAHVCSAGSPCASAPAVPPPCSSGDACKAAPSPQPAVFGAPSSATFSGAGNVTPEAPGKAGQGTQRKAVKCPRGRRLSHGRCVAAKKKGKPAARRKGKAVKVGKTDHKGRR